MNQRSQALSILQKARDALGERLAQRVVESREEIVADAEGSSYLSEIETIYEQIGGRLAHLNAMLANLPPAAIPTPADAAASEIIYADLASAYPTGLDLEGAAPLTLLALPAPPHAESQQSDSMGDLFEEIVFKVQAGELTGASRLISELFDLRPSEARGCVRIFARQLVSCPDLARHLARFPRVLEETDEGSAAALLAECFELPPAEGLAIVRMLKPCVSPREANE